jgi:hypothetical protein
MSRHRIDTHFRRAYTTPLMPKSDRSTTRPTATDAESRPWLYWGLAAAVLILGFADLARGGETIAPILLVLGYCVLIPLAILR